MNTIDPKTGEVLDISSEVPMFEFSADIKDLAISLAKAQQQMSNASKDAKNPYFNSKYADLASILGACKEPLNSNGIAIVQLPAYHGNGLASVTTRLLHGTGQWISCTLRMPIRKEQIKDGKGQVIGHDYSAWGIGSAIAYGRRYTLQALACIAQEDDDANGASTRPPASVQSSPMQRVVEKVKTETSKLSFGKWKGQTTAELTSDDLLLANDFGAKKLQAEPSAAWAKHLKSELEMISAEIDRRNIGIE